MYKIEIDLKNMKVNGKHIAKPYRDTVIAYISSIRRRRVRVINSKDAIVILCANFRDMDTIRNHIEQYTYEVIGEKLKYKKISELRDIAKKNSINLGKAKSKDAIIRKLIDAGVR